MTHATTETITTELIADGISPIAAKAVAGVLVHHDITFEQMSRQIDAILRSLTSGE